MSDDTVKPWKKTEDIPRRFDELPPEPGWVPVADVIRNSREDEAREEAQKEKFKIKPPLDSDSESSDTEAKQGSKSKVEKAPTHKKEERRKHTPSKILDDTSMPLTVDNVTQSMVEWALSPDHYPRRKPKPPTHHKDQIKPLAGKQKPSPLLQEKSHTARDKPDTKQPSRTVRDAVRSHISPRKDTPPDMLSSPSGPKTQGYPSGAPRMRSEQPASNRKEQRPPYDEPSPDYDDGDYNAYYSTYDRQYYREGRPDEDLYAYKDRGVEDPYFHSSSPAYDEYAPYPPQHGYGNPHGDPGYEYEYEYEYEYGEPRYSHEDSEPQYFHEAQSGGYLQPSPYYGPVPQEYPSRSPQPRSSYDVLY